MKVRYSYEQHPLRWWHILLLAILIVGTVFIASERRAAGVESRGAWSVDQLQRCGGMAFGTFYHITYRHHISLDDSIEATLALVDKSLSPFNPASTISAVNENRDLHADAMLSEVFSLAKTVSRRTFGAFDITVAPLVNLWGFGFKNMDNVSPRSVDSLRAFVGIDKVSLQDGIITKTTPSLMLDCSAIAKGYGVDAVGRMLERNGVLSYMVEIGGEVRVRGCNPNGQPWNIGISTPQDDTLAQNDDIQQVLSITDLSLATSGNYRNFYVKDHKKYAHTIDPRTGYPVQHNILSATVLAADCATADAYATAFMVLGLDSARLILECDTTLMAYFIYSVDSTTTSQWYSPRLQSMLKK